MKQKMIYMGITLFVSHTLQANNTPIKREFTVTQIALDAEYNRLLEEDSNTTVEETTMQGGLSEEN